MNYSVAEIAVFILHRPRADQKRWRCIFSPPPSSYKWCSFAKFKCQSDGNQEYRTPNHPRWAFVVVVAIRRGCVLWVFCPRSKKAWRWNAGPLRPRFREKLWWSHATISMLERHSKIICKYIGVGFNFS